jgi:hypothetical protein
VIACRIHENLLTTGFTTHSQAGAEQPRGRTRIFMRAIWALGLLAMAPATPATAQDLALSATGGCTVVTMTHATVPVVDVKIGGKGPYRFAIDTGEQGHGRITEALATELGLPKVGEGLFGTSEVSVGAVSFKNLDLAVLPETGDDLDGVLGSELIKLVQVTLDYGNGRARFGGPELTEGLLLGFDHGVPVFPVDIAGKRFRVHIDTGYAGTPLLLGEDAVRALPLLGEPVARGEVMEVPLAVSVTAGTVALPVRAIGWPTPRSGGNLGSRGLAGMTVTFDSRSELAKVEPSRSSPRCPA